MTQYLSELFPYQALGTSKPLLYMRCGKSLAYSKCSLSNNYIWAAPKPTIATWRQTWVHLPQDDHTVPLFQGHGTRQRRLKSNCNFCSLPQEIPTITYPEKHRLTWVKSLLIRASIYSSKLTSKQPFLWAHRPQVMIPIPISCPERAALNNLYPEL